MWDYTRDGKWEGWRREKKKEVQLIICCCFLCHGFPSSHRQRENIWTFFWARNCVCCSPVVSLPCYSRWRDSTHGISHTERHLPQTCIFTCTFLHTHTHTRIIPQTDAQTLFKYIRRNTTEICIQYTHAQFRTKICHIAAKAGVHLSYVKFA